MVKIFFPFTDKPKQFDFLQRSVIHMPFMINDFLYYCEISPCGITMYLHPAHMSSGSTLMKMMLSDINGKLCIINGNICDDGIPVITLSKHNFIEFKHYGQSLNTIGILDPISLGKVDPFSFINSAEWMALGCLMLKAISKLIISLEHIGMKIRSDSKANTSKEVQLVGLRSTLYSTGIGSQRVASIGEMDYFTLNALNSRLITFRVFDSLGAHISIVTN